MRKYLDKNKIEYIIAHLKLRCDFSAQLWERISFCKSTEVADITGSRLVFPLTDKEKVLDYQIDNLPIFYPIFPEQKQHTFSKNGSVIFSHDIFQQIFCLQTLFYEEEITDRDKLGRIKPEATINHRLGFLKKPLVDYLFAIIVDVLENFCLTHDIYFKRKHLLANHTFLLSHDVDRVETYSFYNTLNSCKKLLFSPSLNNLKNVSKHLKEYSRGSKKDNPLWDFPELRAIEEKYKLKSSYYFLNQGKLHQDAYYSLASPRILKLIKEITADQNEIGLHLTIAANSDENILRQNLQQLNSILPTKIRGVRSHWLRFEPRITPDLLANLNIKYDTSIGHYSQEGFRAATSLPYKLFSFQQNKILDVWEIPLIYMDCMNLDYQSISEEEALQNLKLILAEVVKFKGVFTLLWHNGNFIQTLPYNRHDYFIKLIEMILASQPANLTAQKLITSIAGRD